MSSDVSNLKGLYCDWLGIDVPIGSVVVLRYFMNDCYRRFGSIGIDVELASWRRHRVGILASASRWHDDIDIK